MSLFVRRTNRISRICVSKTNGKRTAQKLDHHHFYRPRAGEMREKRKKRRGSKQKGGLRCEQNGVERGSGPDAPLRLKTPIWKRRDKGEFCKKRPEHTQKPVCRREPTFETDSLVTNVNMRLCINIQRNGRNEEKYVVWPNGTKIGMGLNDAIIVHVHRIWGK